MLFATFTKKHSGKREFLAADSDHLIRRQWIRDCDRPPVRRRRQLFVRQSWRAAPGDTTRGKMRIVLALAVLAALASLALAEQSPRTGEPFRLPLLCNKSGEKISGLTKICYYSCANSEGGITAATYEPCPRWTPRWQLNRTAQFGPNENPQ